MEDQEVSLFSPEAVLMLITAVIVDLLGFLEFIPLIGSIISIFADIFGIIFFGAWIFFRSQRVEITGRATARVGRLARSLRWLRPLCFIGELIPFVGILPLWTLLVFFELKS